MQILPRSVKFNQHVLFALGNELVKILGNSNLDGVSRVVGDSLGLDVGLDLARFDSLHELCEIIHGELGSHLVLETPSPGGEGGLVTGHKVQPELKELVLEVILVADGEVVPSVILRDLLDPISPVVSSLDALDIIHVVVRDHIRLLNNCYS